MSKTHPSPATYRKQRTRCLVLAWCVPLLAATFGQAEVITVTEDWTGSDADPWPAQWTRQDVSADDGASVTIDTNRGKVLLEDNLDDVTMVNFINTHQAEDVEQLMRFSVKAVSGNSVKAGFIARRTDADPDTFYGVSVGARTPANESLQIFKYVDGTQTQIAETLDIVNNETDYFIRFNVASNANDNTDLRVKLWLASDPEPAGWTLEVLNDSTPELQGVSGRFGTYSEVLASNRATFFDDYQASYVAIPEPSGAAAFMLGGVAFAAIRRRKA